MNDNERTKYLKILKKLDQEKPDWNVFDFSWASGLTIQDANGFMKENLEAVRAELLEVAKAELAKDSEETADENKIPLKQTKTGTRRTGSKTTIKDDKE